MQLQTWHLLFSYHNRFVPVVCLSLQKKYRLVIGTHVHAFLSVLVDMVHGVLEYKITAFWRKLSEVLKTATASC